MVGCRRSVEGQLGDSCAGLARRRFDRGKIGTPSSDGGQVRMVQHEHNSVSMHWLHMGQPAR